MREITKVRSGHKVARLKSGEIARIEIDGEGALIFDRRVVIAPARALLFVGMSDEFEVFEEPAAEPAEPDDEPIALTEYPQEEPDDDDDSGIEYKENYHG